MKKIIFILILLIPTLTFSQIPYGNDYINSSNIINTTEWTVSGSKWNCHVVTYKFMNGTNDMVGTTEWDAVRQAFTIWQPHINLVFQEVFGSSEADIRISWNVGSHGDSSPFDGSFGVLAHAFTPPPNFWAFAGDLHFDDAETWTTHTNYGAAQPIDLISVAVHEIGHSLGLLHSEDPNALMYRLYTGSR